MRKLRAFDVSMRNICARFAQDSLPVRNICATFAQDCIFPQCAIYAQDCTYFPNAQYMRNIVLFLQCAIYAQDLRKIILISPMRNICARFEQDCTYFPNAQYIHKIVLISLMCNISARLQALLEEICHISHICSKFRMVFTS